MKQIDLRDKLERRKYATAQETTLHVSGNYIGFRHRDIGVGFIAKTKDGIRTDSNGRPRWYHSLETGLNEACRYVRKLYKVKLPVHGWEAIRVKHYNTSTAQEIVAALGQ